MFEIKSYAPIIILTSMFVLFIGIYLFLFLFSYRMTKRTFMRWIKRILFTSSLVIAIASLTFIFYVQPKLQVVEGQEVKLPNLVEEIMAGSDISSFTDYKQKEWKMDTDEIYIEFQSSAMPEVVVDAHLAKGEKSRITLYETPSFVNGRELASGMLSLLIEEEDVFVNINPPDETVLLSYKPIFTMLQFRPSDPLLQVEEGNQLLYVEVSPEVSIQSNELMQLHHK